MIVSFGPLLVPSHLRWLLRPDLDLLDGEEARGFFFRQEAVATKTNDMFQLVGDPFKWFVMVLVVLVKVEGESTIQGFDHSL